MSFAYSQNEVFELELNYTPTNHLYLQLETPQNLSPAKQVPSQAVRTEMCFECNFFCCQHNLFRLVIKEISLAEGRKIIWRQKKSHVTLPWTENKGEGRKSFWLVLSLHILNLRLVTYYIKSTYAS